MESPLPLYDHSNVTSVHTQSQDPPDMAISSKQTPATSPAGEEKKVKITPQNCGTAAASEFLQGARCVLAITICDPFVKTMHVKSGTDY